MVTTNDWNGERQRKKLICRRQEGNGFVNCSFEKN